MVTAKGSPASREAILFNLLCVQRIGERFSDQAKSKSWIDGLWIIANH